MKTQIRNNPGQSSYFQGQFKAYGRYQWNIKYSPGFDSEYEQESALRWCLGEHVKIGTKASNGNSIYGFEYISELLGRPIESSTAGRSGGWLVIETELTDAELKKIDSHVNSCLESLPGYLAEEREFNRELLLGLEAEDAALEERAAQVKRLTAQLIERAQTVFEEYLDGKPKHLDFAIKELGETLTKLSEFKGEN